MEPASATRHAAGVVNAFVDYDAMKLAVVQRDEAGAVSVRHAPMEHVCYVRDGDLSRSLYGELARGRWVASIGREPGWFRIGWRDRTSATFGSLWLEREGVRTHEATTSPLRRWCVDNGVIPARPRGCFLDIETDSRKTFDEKEQMRVLCWAVVDYETGEHEVGVLAEDTDQDERRLLSDLWKVLDRHDQVISWNGDRFDFPVIRARSRQRKLGVQHQRWLLLDHMRLFERFNRMSAESGEEKQSLALESVARSLKLAGKDEGVSGYRSWEHWAAGGVERAALVKYCLRDAVLMREIEQKTNFIAMLSAVSEITGVFADSRGARPAGQVESFLLRLARESGFRFGTSVARLEEAERRARERNEGLGDEDDEDEPEQYRGAYVMPPASRGILRDVHVLDFSSMYPTIMISWNLSPERKRAGPNNAMLRSRYGERAVVPRPEGCCEGPLSGKWFEVDPVGMFPLALEELLRLRKYWNDLKASLTPGTPEWHDAGYRSVMAKQVANSFYGVGGSPTSAFFDVDVAETTTTTGEWLLRESIKQAESRGMRGEYADTDGVYLTGATDDQVRELEYWLNEVHFPELMRAAGCKVIGRVRIAYEKKLRRIVFVASKKYCASFSHYKGTPAAADSEPEVKGLEYKRGDVNRLTRRFQDEAIRMLVQRDVDDPEEYVALADRWKSRVLDEPLELSDVKLSKGLGRSLSGYATKLKKDGTEAAAPAHVQVARILKERGRDVGAGAKIDYVVVDGGVSPMKVAPAEDWDGTCDRHYLWESLIWPPTQRLLAAAFPHRSWQRWDRTRPVKPRGARGTKPLEGQQGLAFGEAPKARKSKVVVPAAQLDLLSRTLK